MRGDAARARLLDADRADVRARITFLVQLGVLHHRAIARHDFGHRVREVAPFAEADVRDALLRFDPLWDELFPSEQARIVQLLVQRIDIMPEGMRVVLRTDGFVHLIHDLHGPGSSDQREVA